MLVEAYTIPPSAEYPLFVTAKRYWTPESEANGAADPAAAHTLIVLHSTSFHKETWEPTLDELFALADAGSRRNHIRDVWAIECPNHGESALLNHRALSQPQFANDCLYSHLSLMYLFTLNHLSVSCQRYAQAVHRFLTSVGVDFRSRNLIGIGHSLGANAMYVLHTVYERCSSYTGCYYNISNRHLTSYASSLSSQWSVLKDHDMWLSCERLWSQVHNDVNIRGQRSMRPAKPIAPTINSQNGIGG